MSFKLTHKLFYTRQQLIHWDISEFGKMQSKIKELNNELQELQS